MVWGYASTPTKDLQGEVVALDAIKAALPDYMEWANVREMHQPSAVGVTKEATIDENGLYIGAKIVDKDAWEKVTSEVYKGFSIGGERTEKNGDTITGLKLIEISLVDRPANPDCRIEVIKVAGHENVREKIMFEREEIGLLGRLIAKLGGSPSGPPAAHDGFSLPAGPEDERTANRLTHQPKENDGGLTTLPDRCSECGSFLADDDEECPNCEAKLPAHKRAFSDDHRKQLAGEGKAMPDGSYPIETARDLTNAIHAYGRAGNKAKVKEHIIRQAERLKLTDLLPAHWPGSTKEKAAESELTKGLARAIVPLAMAFEAVRDTQRSLIRESQTENGDGTDLKMAEQLAAIANDIAAVIGRKAGHEGKEAQTLTDEDDIHAGIHTDDKRLTQMAEITKRFSNEHKEAVHKARHHVAKAHGSCKLGKSCLGKAANHAAELHKLLSKASKASAQDPFTSHDLEGITTHVGKIAEHLSEAHEQLGDTQDHCEMAHAHLGKAESHWVGEHGEAPGDPEDGLYKPETGLSPLAQDDLTGGDVPNYPANQPYQTTQGTKPGKARPEGITQSAQIVELSKALADAREQHAFLKGQVEAMSRLPLPARARAFAVSKGFMGEGMGSGDQPNDRTAALLEGVNPNATDGDAAIKNGARMIGNMIKNSSLFGKSLFDPAYKGGVGK